MLAEAYEENPFSQSYNWKRRSILKDFSNNYGYAYLILHHNLTSGILLKAGYNVEPETVLM